MKSAALVPIALFLSLFTYCQTWKRTGVENAGREIFYNADNITTLDMGLHKNVSKVWLKEQFVNEKISGIFYASGYTLTLYAFDCNEKSWSMEELIFSKPSGDVIRDYTYDTEWDGMPAGSPMALLSYFICQKYPGK